jgi:hypothetical protein
LGAKRLSNGLAGEKMGHKNSQIIETLNKWRQMGTKSLIFD